jgi:hypothetical protein
LLNPPREWSRSFDFVLESYTLQVLPPDLREQAIERAADFVRQGGKLLLIARAREEHEPEGEMPWPLTRREVERFANGLSLVSFEDFRDDEIPPVRRFMVLFERPSRPR